MPGSGLDERVARLEGRVEGFDDRFDGLGQRMGRLEQRMDRLEQRLGESTTLLSTRIDTLDAKVDRFRTELSTDLGGRLQALDQKGSRHFTWIVGIQVAVLLAVVAALAGR